MALSVNDRASAQVRAIASFKLHELKSYLNSQQATHSRISDQAHIYFSIQQIEQFEKDPKQLVLVAPVEAPDGPPIGSATFDCDWD